MATNLNHGVVQGRVIAVNLNDVSVRIALAVSDDWKDKNGQWTKREYVFNIFFMGEFWVERLEKQAVKGTVATIEYKLATYTPKEAQYPVISVQGTSYHAAQSHEANKSAEKPRSTKTNTRPSTTDSDPEFPF